MEETLSVVEKIVEIIKQQWDEPLDIGIILGSGLEGLAASITQTVKIPYKNMPGWSIPTVEGHSGQLAIGRLNQKNVIIMQGRVHFYEGYSMTEVTRPIRVMQKLGIKVLIVTNAAGGINQSFTPGDIMLITDQINLLGMAGSNPLIGKNLDEFGPRFPDMSQAYDRELMKIARDVSVRNGISLQEGVYAGLGGPSFETPAELRFLQAVGVDAVGMSTVSEVTVARHGGLRVLGFSGISNKASLDGLNKTTHEEVLAAGRIIAPKLKNIILDVVSEI